MPPIKVFLLIDELLTWSGTEVHLRRLVAKLDRERVTPVLAIVQNSELAEEFARATGAEIKRLDIPSTLSLDGLRGAASIARMLRDEGADLVVTYHTASDLLGPVAGQLAGVPVLSCRRDEGFTKKPVHVAVQRHLNRFLRGMIHVSLKVRTAVNQSEGYPTAKGEVIWNGEDLERFSPGASGIRAELGLADEAPVIASVSILTPIKDHETQFQAMAQVTERHPDAVLLVVGGGPRMDELQAAAAPLGDSVRFLDHRADIPDLLRGCDLLLQTSLSEGFSNTILQAMATALPVVVTSVGGNVELVSSDTGFLVDRHDPDRVARHINQLLASPDLRRKMGAAARARVEQHCSLATMVERYSDAFERAVRGEFPGPASQ